MSNAAKSRLGRGLGAIISAANKEHGKDAENEGVKSTATLEAHKDSKVDGHFLELPIHLIVPNPYQPRRSINQEQIIELSESIRHQGLIQPIVVRQIGEGYELIAGERRLQACKHLQFKKIPARVIHATEESSAVLSLIENLQREDLNSIDEALGFKQLTNKFGLTQEEIATRVGKARASIANSLRLLQLDEAIQEMIKNGHISTGHAKLLLSVENKEQRLLFAKKIAETGMSVRECELQIARQKNLNHQRTPDTTISSSFRQEMKNWERKLAAKLEAKVSLKSLSPDSGKIVISYQTPSELKSILSKLEV